MKTAIVIGFNKDILILPNVGQEVERSRWAATPSTADSWEEAALCRGILYAALPRPEVREAASQDSICARELAGRIGRTERRCQAGRFSSPSRRE